MAELGVGHISIVAETSGLSRSVEKSLRGIGDVGGKAGRSIGERISSGITRTLKVGAAAAGVAAGGVLATSITKGLGRLTAIDSAEAKLAGLGHTTESTAAVMDSALESVSGTAFGLGDAATIAAGAVAAGIEPGKELTKYLSMTADAAAIAGADLSEMGSIINQVQTGQVAYTDNLNQLADRGIPIYTWLAEEAGVAQEEVKALASEGAISSEMFFNAIQNNIGGAAQKIGELSIAAAFDNLGAAAGRFGATLTGPAFSAAPPIISALTSSFDAANDAIAPAAERIGELLTPALETVADLIETRVTPMLAAAGEKVGEFAVALTERAVDPALWERIGEVFGSIRDTAERLWPSLQSIGESFLTIAQNISAATWQALTSALNALAPLVESVLVPLLENVAAFAEQNPGAVQAMVLAFIGFKGVSAAVGPVATFTSTLGHLGGAFSQVSKLVQVGGVTGGIKAVGQFAGTANPVLSTLGGVVTNVGGAFGAMGSFLGPVVKVLATAIRFINPWVAGFTLLGGALTWFFTQTEMGQGIWDGFVGGITAGVDWIVEKFTQFTSWVSTAWSGLTALFTEGDYTGAISDAFGIEEDSPIIAGFFFLRDTIVGVVDWIKGAWSTLGEVWSSVYTGFIQPVFDAFVTAGQYLVAIIGTAVLAPIMIAWELLSAAFRAYWENYLKPVLEAFADLGLWLWENALQPAFEGISLAWEALGVGVQSVWEGIIQPAWAAVSSFVTETLWPALQTAFEWIVTAWTALGDGIRWVWETVIQVAWSALQSAATWMWENVLSPVFGFIGNAWNLLATGIQWAWENVILPAWNALSSTLTWLWENVVSPILGWIGDRWTQMAEVLEFGWNWIRDNVFDPLGTGLETVQSWFQAAVDGIGTIWDGLRAAAAKPVKFVIDTVWNNGILAAWNKIAEFLPGIDEKDPVPLGDLGNYAVGGVLPGYTPGRDPYEFIEPRTGMRIGLSGGEAIMRPEWTRAVGGPQAVERMNKAARAGQLDPKQLQTGYAHAFASGGVIDLGNFQLGGVLITTAIQSAMRDIVKAKYPNIVLTSATRPGHSGYHGTGQATDWATAGAFGNSPEQLALAHDIAQTYPGSAQLIYDSPGWAGNIYEGSPAGAMDSGIYKTAQAGPHHNHVHWAMTTPPTMQFGGGVFEGGSSGGGLGAAVVNWVADRARGIWETLVSPIRGFIDDKLGEWGDSVFTQIPGAMFTSLRDTAWNFLSSLFGRGGGSDSGSVDVSDISGPVVDQVEAVFARHGFTGAEWEAAKWIIQRESGWNPTAVNPSSGAYGLFQFNPMGGNTLGAYLPDRNPDPAVQADAGARYMKDRYGSPTAAKAFWEQNQWYADGGIIDLPDLSVFDTGGVLRHGAAALNLSGQPEVVINGPQLAAINNLANNIGALVPQLEALVRGGEVEAAAQLVADTLTTEFEVLRSSAEGGEFGNVGVWAATATLQEWSDIIARTPLAPLTEWSDGLIKADADIKKSREDQAAAAQGVIEAQEALAEAQRELAAAQAGQTEESVDAQRKVEDAQKSLTEAQEEAAKVAAESYDSEEKRTEAIEKANTKVTDAEEKLTRAREDAAADAEKQAEKQAETVAAAQEAVTAAELDLADARGVVTAAAAAAGFAEIGMIFAVIDVITQLVEHIQSSFRAAEQAVNEAMGGMMSSIRQLNTMVKDQQNMVLQLSMQLAEQQIAQRQALFELRTAERDSHLARLQSLIDVNQAVESSAGSMGSAASDAVQIGSTSVSALAEAVDRFRVDGVWAVDEVSSAVSRGAAQAGSAAAGAVRNYAAEQHRTNAAALRGKQAEYEATLAEIQATFAHHQAVINVQRTQEDLGKAAERLAKMTGETWGFTESEAVIGEHLAELYARRADLQAEMDDWTNKLSIRWQFMGGREAVEDALAIVDQQIEDAISRPEWEGMGEGWEGEARRVSDEASRLFLIGLEEEGRLLLDNFFGAAERALREADIDQALWDIEDRDTEAARSLEDSVLQVMQMLKEQPLHELIDAWDSWAAAEETRAEAEESSDRETREWLREMADIYDRHGDEMALAAEESREISITVEMPSGKTSYTAEEVYGLLGSLNDKLSDYGTRLNAVERAGAPDAANYANVRR